MSNKAINPKTASAKVTPNAPTDDVNNNSLDVQPHIDSYLDKYKIAKHLCISLSHIADLNSIGCRNFISTLSQYHCAHYGSEEDSDKVAAEIRSYLQTLIEDNLYISLVKGIDANSQLILGMFYRGKGKHNFEETFFMEGLSEERQFNEFRLSDFVHKLKTFATEYTNYQEMIPSAKKLSECGYGIQTGQCPTLNERTTLPLTLTNIGEPGGKHAFLPDAKGYLKFIKFRDGIKVRKALLSLHHEILLPYGLAKVVMHSAYFEIINLQDSKKNKTYPDYTSKSLACVVDDLYMLNPETFVLDESYYEIARVPIKTISDFQKAIADICFK